MIPRLIMQAQAPRQPNYWLVKTRQGGVVGHVKSLTICHTSKQVVSALLVLRDNGQQMHIAWERFEIAGEQLMLRVPVELVRLAPHSGPETYGQTNP